jgi:hypothetical protein
MQYPTVAPSGIDHYGFTNIPGWHQSLLIPTLRRGTLYRYKLNAARNGIDNDSVPYFFRTDRYRDIALKNGNIIFTVTDSIGSTSGPSGSGTSALSRPGTILKYTFLGYQNNGVNNKSTLPATIDVTDGPVNTSNSGSTVTIDATNSNYWVPLTGSDGNILAEIFANGQTLGTVTSCFYKNAGAIRTQGSARYLDRNITITPQFQPVTPVRIRIYFSKTEFDALDLDPLSGITSIADIKILKNADACGSGVSSTTTMINPVYAEAHGTDGYVVQASISGFSSFYFGSSNLILPLRLITFNANYFNSMVLLRWETEQERNTDYFVIERNTGNGYKETGTVTAGGNTSARAFYNFTDNEAATLGVSSAQYRLKIIDKDGKFVYSPVVFISFADLVNKIQVNPNPVRDGLAKITISAAMEQQAIWKLTDNTGRVVISGNVQLLKGLNSFSIHTEKLSSGVYYLGISSPGINKQVRLQKL